jgi:hypothetical protein
MPINKAAGFCQSVGQDWVDNTEAIHYNDYN